MREQNLDILRSIMHASTFQKLSVLDLWRINFQIKSVLDFAKNNPDKCSHPAGYLQSTSCKVA
jgi:hypothetical protein